MTVFSGGLLSFELSVELGWLWPNSSISTIMHPADGEIVSEWLDPGKRDEPS